MRFDKVYLLCSMLCWFMLACSAKSNRLVEKKDTDTTLVLNTYKVHMSSISETEYKKGVQAKQTQLDVTPVNKNKDELILRLAGNKKIVLKDSLANTDNTEQLTYNYVGYFKDVGFYVVKAQYYETGEYLLINYQTGFKTKMWGEPKLSPDKKHIVAVSNTVGYDIMPNGIQMWVIQKGDIKIKWEYKQEQWGPDGIVWVNNRVLYFVKWVPDFISQTKKEEKFYIAITME